MGVTVLCALTVGAVLGLTIYTRGDPNADLEVGRTGAGPSPKQPRTRTGKHSLTVLTLNMAHGRKDTRHQAFLRKGRIQSHLAEIADMLERVGPDIAALQETDGPSIWSGNFSHVEYLAERAGFPYFVHGEHVRGLKLAYGTALLSHALPEEPTSVTFRPSPPTFSKGYVLATIDHPASPTGQVDVVSVHLDYAREKTRKRQVANMVKGLSARENPLVLMGDLNCGWSDGENALRALVSRLDIHAYEPQVLGQQTFPLTGQRLDWILVSHGLEFVKHQVLDDVVSDHRPVFAELRFREPEAGPRGSASSRL